MNWKYSEYLSLILYIPIFLNKTLWKISNFKELQLRKESGVLLNNIVKLCMQGHAIHGTNDPFSIESYSQQLGLVIGQMIIKKLGYVFQKLRNKNVSISCAILITVIHLIFCEKKHFM